MEVVALIVHGKSVASVHAAAKSLEILVMIRASLAGMILE